MHTSNACRLSERQQRELDYHREHAKKHDHLLRVPFNWDVLDRPSRRWWNAHWHMYAHLIELDLKGKRVLVIGCGFGDDAIRLAKLGAEVYACDLSPDSVSIARRLASREGVSVHFEEMPAEALTYASDIFDCIVARDILHHVDIPRTLNEVRRVAKPGAILVINEIYSHSITNCIRHSTVVIKVLYPRMQRFIYGPGTPYITADERKINESELRCIMAALETVDMRKYFNCLVTRVFPDTYHWLSRIDRLLLMMLKPLAHLLAGRVLLSGRLSK